MIGMNKGLVPCILEPYSLKAGYKKVFAVFDGTMPTKAEIEALYTGSTFTLPELKSFAETKGTFRGHFLYEGDMIADLIQPNFLRWVTSERSEEMDVAALGNVTWFFFAIVDGTAANINADVDVHHAYIGDITTDGAGGDLEIIGGSIGANQNYLLNDLEITYKV